MPVPPSHYHCFALCWLRLGVRLLVRLPLCRTVGDSVSDSSSVRSHRLHSFTTAQSCWTRQCPSFSSSSSSTGKSLRFSYSRTVFLLETIKTSGSKFSEMWYKYNLRVATIYISPVLYFGTWHHCLSHFVSSLGLRVFLSRSQCNGILSAACDLSCTRSFLWALESPV